MADKDSVRDRTVFVMCAARNHKRKPENSIQIWKNVQANLLRHGIPGKVESVVYPVDSKDLALEKGKPDVAVVTFDTNRCAESYCCIKPKEYLLSNTVTKHLPKENLTLQVHYRERFPENGFQAIVRTLEKYHGIVLKNFSGKWVFTGWKFQCLFVTKVFNIVPMPLNPDKLSKYPFRVNDDVKSPATYLGPPVTRERTEIMTQLTPAFDKYLTKVQALESMQQEFRVHIDVERTSPWTYVCYIQGDMNHCEMARRELDRLKKLTEDQFVKFGKAFTKEPQLTTFLKQLENDPLFKGTVAMVFPGRGISIYGDQIQPFVSKIYGRFPEIQSDRVEVPTESMVIDSDLLMFMRFIYSHDLVQISQRHKVTLKYDDMVGFSQLTMKGKRTSEAEKEIGKLAGQLAQDVRTESVPVTEFLTKIEIGDLNKRFLTKRAVLKYDHRVGCIQVIGDKKTVHEVKDELMSHFAPKKGDRLSDAKEALASIKDAAVTTMKSAVKYGTSTFYAHVSPETGTGSSDLGTPGFYSSTPGKDSHIRGSSTEHTTSSYSRARPPSTKRSGERAGSRGRTLRLDPSYHPSPSPTSFPIQGPAGKPITIHVEVGDITKLPVDAIVNAANSRLRNAGGVAGAISKAAGQQFDHECYDIIQWKGPIKVTENYVTQAGNLPCKNVVHALGPSIHYYKGREPMCKNDLQRTFTHILERAQELGFRSIAIPAISSGNFGVPIETVSEVMARAVVDFLCTKHCHLRDVHLIDINPLNISLIQADVHKKMGYHGSSSSGSSAPSGRHASREARAGPGGGGYGREFTGGAAEGFGDSVGGAGGGGGYRGSAGGRGGGGFGGSDRGGEGGGGGREGSRGARGGEADWEKLARSGKDSESQAGEGARSKDVNLGKGAAAKIAAASGERRREEEGKGAGTDHTARSSSPALYPSLEEDSGTTFSWEHDDDMDPSEHQYLPPPHDDYTPSAREPSHGAASASSDDADDQCPICMDAFTDVKKLKCGHQFCTECIESAFSVKSVCPICGEVYGVLKGNQPDGTMKHDTEYRKSLPGYPGVGTIVINYQIKDGRQGPDHPSPGAPYRGTQRTAYLPDTSEGRKVLRLLKKAFDQKLTFTIGRSTTSGRDNIVTWNDIHHKTNIDGGPARFGYPDDTYLKRVQEELAAKGIKEE